MFAAGTKGTAQLDAFFGCIADSDTWEVVDTCTHFHKTRAAAQKCADKLVKACNASRDVYPTYRYSD